MRFLPPRTKKGRDASVVPMINVVFLLLIFFLMAARIAPPPPLEVDLPQAASEERTTAETILFVGADGAVRLAGAPEGDPWAHLAAGPPEGPLALRADAALPAAELAALLTRLASIGLTDVALAVVPR